MRLVSIIIPTFNRCDLIGSTLLSVLQQSYKNFECIVIDDQSSDETDKLLQFYVQRDARIKFYKRPENHRPGANSCRNFGFELSTGEYVMWLDSDDLLDENYLLEKLNVFQRKGEVDLIISKYLNFDLSQNFPEKAFDLNVTNPVTAINYITHKNYWATSDVLVKRIKIGTIRFNENLKSGQEYNFFAKLLIKKDLNICFLNRDLVLKRIHNSSIQAVQERNEDLYLMNKLDVYYYTYREIRKDLRAKNLRIQEIFFLNQLKSLKFRLALRRKIVYKIIRINRLFVQRESLVKIIYFNLSLFTGFCLGKGLVLNKLSRNRLK